MGRVAKNEGLKKTICQFSSDRSRILGSNQRGIELLGQLKPNNWHIYKPSLNLSHPHENIIRISKAAPTRELRESYCNGDCEWEFPGQCENKTKGLPSSLSVTISFWI